MINDYVPSDGIPISCHTDWAIFYFNNFNTNSIFSGSQTLHNEACTRQLVLPDWINHRRSFGSSKIISQYFGSLANFLANLSPVFSRGKLTVSSLCLLNFDGNIFSIYSSQLTIFMALSFGTCKWNVMPFFPQASRRPQSVTLCSPK